MDPHTKDFPLNAPQKQAGIIRLRALCDDCLESASLIFVYEGDKHNFYCQDCAQLETAPGEWQRFTDNERAAADA